MTRNARWVALLTLVVLAALYLYGLDRSPVYLLNDEVFGAIQTLSLATTGRSVAGDFLPIYFRGLEFPPGRDPLSIYATASFLTALPVSEWSLRLPTALVGVANVMLAFVLCRRLWGDLQLALLAAMLLAFTPAHFILSRIAIPPLWSLPGLLGWLIGLADYATTSRTNSLAAAMFCLGLAFYGYLGTALCVPLYAAGTVAYLYFGVGERRWRPYVAAAIGLAVPMTLLLYWQIVHPGRWSELADYYLTDRFAIKSGTPLVSASRGVNFAAVQERVTAYWNYFDPSFLFLGGDHSPRYSTGRSGVFALAAAALMPVGIYQAIGASALGRLIVWCFVVTPLPAALGVDVQIQRALPLVLFGWLLSAWGVVRLITDPMPPRRLAAATLAALAVFQFAFFVGDYFGHYRLRSGGSRGGNLRGAFEEVVAAAREQDRPIVYLSEAIPNVDVYWRFYAVALRGDRQLPQERVTPLAGGFPNDAPPGALAITLAQEMPDARAGTATASPWQLRKRIYELDGPTFYSVYERAR